MIVEKSTVARTTFHCIYTLDYYVYAHFMSQFGLKSSNVDADAMALFEWVECIQPMTKWKCCMHTKCNVLVDT